MTIESLPGSVTAPDPLEVENDALRAEVAAERKEREVWASRARDYCKSWDDSRAAAERLQTVAFQAQNAAIDLAQQVATLTAERSAARAELSRRQDESVLIDHANRLVAGEREACAETANRHLNAVPIGSPEWTKGYRDACADIETAIRAKKGKP